MDPEEALEALRELCLHSQEMHKGAMQSEEVQDSEAAFGPEDLHRQTAGLYGGFGRLLDRILDGEDPFAYDEDGNVHGITITDEDGNEKGWWPEVQ